MVKAVAAGAVMVAAALPVAIASTAGAATAPTLTCTSVNTSSCTTGFAVIGQGFSGNFWATGAGFANDQGVGGNVTLTTTAPGVTFTNVLETSATTITATISSTTATTPGFYPVTLVDTNGTATLALGLGVDHGPTVTAVAGNAVTAGGTATVTVTGNHLRNAVPTFAAVTGAPTVASYVNSSDTTLTFVVNNANTAGTFSWTITGYYPYAPYGQPGSVNGSFTVNASATPVTISAVTPNFLGIPDHTMFVGPSSNAITISGTGFETGATLALVAPFVTGVSIGSFTIVNSTTITATVIVQNDLTTTAAGQASLKITNPDTTSVTGVGIVGIGTPAATTTAGPTPPVAPTLNCTACFLTPGTQSIIFAQGSAGFPLTTGSTVKVSVPGVTNATQILSGTVLSVDSTNTARIQVVVPRYTTTTLASATIVGATNFPLTDASGLGAGSQLITIFDGTSTEGIFGHVVGNNFIDLGPAAAFAHAAGVMMEFSYPGAANVLTVSNGVNTETAPVTVNAPPAAVVSLPNGTTAPFAMAAGTYTVNAYVPGFGFKAGSAIFFNKDNVTGTVTVVNGNVATLNVTVPAVRSVTAAGVLSAPAAPGQVGLQVTDTTGLAVGGKITVNTDLVWGTPETFTITSLSVPSGPGTVGVSTPVTLNHSTNATITNLSAPQSTTDAVSALILNGAGLVFGVQVFFGPPIVSTATPVPATLGGGATTVPVDFTLVAANGDLTNTHWTATSTKAGVTFGAVTSASATDIIVPVSVAAGTAVGAAPVVLTDGANIYTSSLTIAVGPTITSLTAIGALVAGGSELIGVNGTNFVLPGAGAEGDPSTTMSCTTSDAAIPCAVFKHTATDSTTTMTVVIGPVGPGALNGSDSITVQNIANFGSATFANAFTVSGQPVVTNVSPAVVPSLTHPTVTVTGTLLPTTGTPFCSASYFLPNGTPIVTLPCTYTFGTATTGTVTAYASYPAGDTVVFTVGSTTRQANTPSVLYQQNPGPNSMYPSSFIASSVNVPFKINDSHQGFLPGAKVTIPALAGTVTVTEVTPGSIYGTISLLSTANAGCTGAPIGFPCTVLLTVTNTNGGAGTYNFTVTAPPTITSIVPGSVLEGKANSLVITGTGFYPGATIVGLNPALATYPTPPVASNCAIAVPLTGPCTTLTVAINPLTFTGNVPIQTGLMITNPVGFGMVSSSATAVTINPVPVVTGTYYVPTFATNVEVTINGDGFQSGITALSSNTDYKILLVASTPNTVTLLVNTTSGATAGTSSTITFTNPDGGTTTFALNGGPVPMPLPKITSISGAVAAKGTSILVVHGSGFYGQPSVRSSKGGTKAVVQRNNGSTMVVRVTVKPGTHKGTYRMTFTFAHGEVASVVYRQL